MWRQNLWASTRFLVISLIQLLTLRIGCLLPSCLSFSCIVCSKVAFIELSNCRLSSGSAFRPIFLAAGSLLLLGKRPSLSRHRKWSWTAAIWGILSREIFDHIWLWASNFCFKECLLLLCLILYFSGFLWTIHWFEQWKR